MKPLLIAGTNLRRFVRDRSNIFFVLIFPLALVLVIGLQFGEQQDPRVGLVGADGTVGRSIAEWLAAADQIDLRLRDDPDELFDDVASGVLDAGVVLPDGLDDIVQRGAPLEVQFANTNEGIGPQLRAIVQDAIARATAEQTAVIDAVGRGLDEPRARALAAQLGSGPDLIDVRTITTGERLFPEDLAGFDIGAPNQLVLFVFLTALTGSTALIQTRRLGLSARMLATPTPLRSIIAGEALGRFAVAAVQGVYILVASSLLFGVDWGDVPGAIAVLTMFAAVGAAAAMLAGSLFRSDQQAAGITIIVSLALAALGGAMLPIELFNDTLLSIAKFTPHYWAIDALSELIRHDGTILDIGRQLGVLALFALGIGVVAIWQARRTLTRV